MIPAGAKLTFAGADEGRDMPVASNAGAQVRGKPANVNDSDWEKVQSELGKMSSNSMSLDQLRNAAPNSLGNDPKMVRTQRHNSARRTAAHGARRAAPGGAPHRLR